MSTTTEQFNMRRGEGLPYKTLTREEAFTSFAQEPEMEMMVDGEEELAEFNEDYKETLLEMKEKQERQEQISSVLQPSPEEAEALKDVPASPIRFEWPKDSLLPPDHGTTDHQKCLVCSKDLGYALPMNRIPKTKYLFCDTPACQNSNDLPCLACGHHTMESRGHLVNRPGNSFYAGASSIHAFICKSCYQDQLDMEPGLEETQEMMKKYRAERQANEERDKDIAHLAANGDLSRPSQVYDHRLRSSHLREHPPTFESELPFDQPVATRKRSRLEFAQ
jgi:hypothetical protein